MLARALTLCVCFVVFSTCLADAASEGQSTRRSKVGYDDIFQFGGGDSVSAQLKANDDFKSARYDSVWLQGFAEPYFDFKRRLKNDYGLAFGIDTWLAGQYASDVRSDTDDTALGYIFRFQGKWTFIGRGTANAGRIEWRVENRGNVGGGNVTPVTLGENVGLAALNSGWPYNQEFDWDIAVLNYTQGVLDNRLGFAVGRLAFDAYLDANPFQTPSGGFLNRGLWINPTLPTTGVGALGAAVQAFVTSNVRVGAQIYDANAENGSFDFETVEEGEYLKAVEIGWSPSIARSNSDFVQFTYWRTDRRDLAQLRKGEGWTATATWELTRLTGIVRYGNSNGGGGVAAKEFASAAVRFKSAFDQQVSVGLAWTQPSNDPVTGDPRRDEYAAEVSYMYQLSPNLSITPDLQYVRDPSADPEVSSAWVVGARFILNL